MRELFPEFEHPKGCSGTVRIDERGISRSVCADVGQEKVPLAEEGGFPRREVVQPVREVTEIDVGGEVLSARILIDGMARDALLEMIAAQRAIWAAVIQSSGLRAVVDGEHGPFLPVWHPVGEPVLDGLMDLEDLAGAMRKAELDGSWKLSSRPPLLDWHRAGC